MHLKWDQTSYFPSNFESGVACSAFNSLTAELELCAATSSTWPPSRKEGNLWMPWNVECRPQTISSPVPVRLRVCPPPQLHIFPHLPVTNQPFGLRHPRVRSKQGPRVVRGCLSVLEQQSASSPSSSLAAGRQGKFSVRDR